MLDEAFGTQDLWNMGHDAVTSELTTLVNEAMAYFDMDTLDNHHPLVQI